MARVLGFSGHNRPRQSGADTLFADWDHFWYWHSSAAALSGSEIVAAVEEERLNRHKHTGVFPTGALEYCLRSLDGPPDAIAFGYEGGFGDGRDPSLSERNLRGVLARECGLTDSGIPLCLVDHHRAHAFSAAIASGFDDALVVTMDGFGDGIAGSVAVLSGGTLQKPHRTWPLKDSIGQFYETAMAYLGYGVHDQYKVMGLAPYGNPVIYRDFVAELYELSDRGEFTIKCNNREQVYEMLRWAGPARRRGGDFLDHHRNVAAAFQDALERIVSHVLRHEMSQSGLTRLCMAGGVAHNSAMTRGLIRELGLTDLFIQPAASDAGLALGAAYAAAQELGELEPRRMEHAYLGPEITSREVDDTLERWKDWIEIETPEDLPTRIAGLVTAGTVVALAQGRAEFGPRALGNRSILADPREAGNQDRVNLMVKSRESYRPFAPVVTEEAADAYFELDLDPSAYRFMTLVASVKPEHRGFLPSTTHVDGSARVQTVNSDQNPLLHRVLEQVGAITGVPVLLNTSLNNNREPIVTTANDVIVFLLTTGVDCVAVHDRIVRRKDGAGDTSRLASAEVRLRPGALAGAVTAPDGSPRYRVTGPDRSEVEISEPTFGLITGLGSPREVDTAELMTLWQARLIDVLPADALRSR